MNRIPGIVERVRVRADEKNHPLAGMIERTVLKSRSTWNSGSALQKVSVYLILN